MKEDLILSHAPTQIHLHPYLINKSNARLAAALSREETKKVGRERKVLEEMGLGGEGFWEGFGRGRFEKTLIIVGNSLEFGDKEVKDCFIMLN